MSDETFMHYAVVTGVACWGFLAILSIYFALQESDKSTAICLAIILPLFSFFPAYMYGLCFMISIPATVMGLTVWSYRKVSRHA